MKSAFAIALEAISLYREYLEQHGYDPERAAAAAALEVSEGQQALEEMESSEAADAAASAAALAAGWGA